MKEVEIAVQNKMENVYGRLKARVDEKASVAEVDAKMRTKANGVEVNKWRQVVDGKIIQEVFEVMG